VVIRTVLGVAITASTACSYGGGFVDCEIACTPPTGCPAGFACSASEGRCRSGATTASCAAILDGGVDGDGADGLSLACPAAFGGSRYLFVNMLVTWPAAEASCKSLDSTPGDGTYVHLVVVNSAGELGQLTPTGTPMDDAWLGYSDSKNPSGSADAATIAANFRWITDEQPAPGFAMWASGQPDETTPPRCAYKNFVDGLMHDRACDHTRTFFCECDAFDENPNNR
jgi:hypothetical protein